MATKSTDKNAEIAQDVTNDSRRSNAGDNTPFAAEGTNPDLNRGEPTIFTPDTTFDERTGVKLPFVLSDGTQDNGSRDLAEVEGAKASATREGDTPTAIEAAHTPDTEDK